MESEMVRLLIDRNREVLCEGKDWQNRLAVLVLTRRPNIPHLRW